SLLDTYHFFLFYRPLFHPDLHSFPTRRSSDLAQNILTFRDCFPYSFLIVKIFTALLNISDFYRIAQGNAAAVWLFGAGNHTEERSEEHTSELQSRENLVCRLLLEKKKKQTNKL